MNRQPVLFRLVALLVIAVVALPSNVGAAPGDASPFSTCTETVASPQLTRDDRVRLLFEARPPAGVRITPETVCAARDVMAARLDSAELDALVTVDGDDRIVVEVSGDADLTAVTRQVTRVGLLEIIDPQGQTLLVGTLVETSLGGPETVLSPSTYAGEAVDDSAYTTIVSGADIDAAYVTRDPFGQPTVGFELSDDGADRFYDYTSANVGQPMAIVLDKRVISSPVIQDAISGTGVITGPSEDEVAELVLSLNTEPLPVPFEVVTIDGTPVESDGTPDAMDGTPVAASS